MEAGVAGSTVADGGGSTVWKEQRLQVAQQVQGGGDQGGSIEVTANGFNQRRGDGGFTIVSCNAVDKEHRFRQRNGVLSGGGTDERIAGK